MERWKDVEEFEGLYQVSNLGRVRSCNRYTPHWAGGQLLIKGRILKQAATHEGYLRVNCCKNCKGYTRSVHRLVAKAFLPNPENLPQVNHKDCNPRNNNCENLEWCTLSYNVKYSHKHGKMRDVLLSIKRNKIGRFTSEKV